MQAERTRISSPGATTLPRWLTVVLLSALIGAGAFLRVRLTLDRPLWDDELWQRFVVQRSSWWNLLLWRHEESVHPPLSFMLNRLCFDIFKSDAPWVWRLPSLLAGVLCIPAAFAVGRRLGSITWALGAAAMVAFDLNVVWESADARMYTMLALGTIVAIGAAWPILHPHETSRRRAIWLGIVLALLIWTHLLAVVIWGAFGLAAAFLLARSWRDQHRREMLANVAIAFGMACLLGLPGVLRVLAVRGGVVAGVPDRTPSETLHLLYWIVNLLVWIPVRFLSPLALFLSAVGVMTMLRRFRELAVLLLGLGLVTAISQIHLLHTHPFSIMRYFIPAQPILWFGLPFLFLLVPPAGLRPYAIAIFALFITVQVWNCTRLEQTYGTTTVSVEESRAFVKAVDFVKTHRQPDEAVTYVPHERAYCGEYFGLPTTESLGGPARPAAPRLPMKIEARATWVVARATGGAAFAPEDEELVQVLAALTWHYRITLGKAPPLAQTPGGAWLVVRVASEGTRFASFPWP